MKITADTIASVSSTLGATTEQNGQEWIIRADGRGGTPGFVATITILESGSAVISVQTVHGYFELHDVANCVLVEPDEAIFVSEHANRISGIVVGRQGTCSSFANVDKSILSADFTALEPALLLAAMQLGLTEQVSA